MNVLLDLYTMPSLLVLCPGLLTPRRNLHLRCSIEQVAFDADGGEELRLSLGAERQAPELDKAEGGVMIELVAGIVGCQAVTVERVLRFAPDDRAMPTRELHANRAADKALRTLH